MVSEYCSASFVAIITVVYNDLTGLALSYDSIVQQNFTDYEWIVVDGGSNDGSVEFLRNLDQHGLTWLSEKDSGIYDAMNKGIDLAHGKFLLFMNAGDIFPGPNVLRDVRDCLKNSAEPDILFGGATFVFPNGSDVSRPPREMERYIWHGLPANHQATYYRRDRLHNVRYDSQYKICGDYYLVAKLFSQGLKAIYLDKPLINFRVGDTSYRHPILLFRESNRIQRDVLRLSLLTRGHSFVKRLISTVGLILLSQPWAKCLYKLASLNSSSYNRFR